MVRQIRRLRDIIRKKYMWKEGNTYFPTLLLRTFRKSFSNGESFLFQRKWAIKCNNNETIMERRWQDWDCLHNTKGERRRLPELNGVTGRLISAGVPVLLSLPKLAHSTIFSHLTPHWRHRSLLLPYDEKKVSRYKTCKNEAQFGFLFEN